MTPKPYYSRQSLADECGLSLRRLDEHIKSGTRSLNKAVEKIPGVGVRINGPLAKKFIQTMQAGKLSTYVAV